MNSLALKQGSQEWHDYRLGRCTGSRVKDALAINDKGTSLAPRRKYLMEVVCERLTGMSARHVVTPEMVWGSDNEALAASAYEVRTGADLELVGIYQHPTIPMFCASPDRIFGADGVWEGKCPTTFKHVEWMEADRIPEEHELQCWAELACSERAYLDFSSFDPRLPEEMQLFTKRMFSNPDSIRKVEDGVRTFLADVEAILTRLRERYPAQQIAEEAEECDPQEWLTDADLDAAECLQ